MITVCIPTYNGEKYIGKQLDSILLQLAEEDEIIISDDSSTDTTIAIIESYKDNRIRLLKNNKFKNPSFNLENALMQAKGDLIYLSDQDDIWMDNKIEICSKKIIGYDLLVSDCILIDENDNQIKGSFYTINKSKSGFVNNLVNNSYLGCCMTFNRRILDYVLPFPRGIAMHDIWIGLNTEVIGKARFINDKLIMYRRHGENTSSAAEKSKFTLYFKLHYRVKFIIYIVLRILNRSKKSLKVIISC